MKIVGFTAIIAGGFLLQSGSSAWAQTVSPLQIRSDMTMQDMENNAIRTTMGRISAGTDATPGSTNQGNLFQITQTGDYNTVNGTQTGTGNVALVTQMGQLNSVTILQSGTGNRATLHQAR